MLEKGGTPISTHWGKVEQAADLTKKHKLPDIADLLKDLNELRKAEAYGDSDVDESDYDAKAIATEIEVYFNKASEFCE